MRPRRKRIALGLALCALLLVAGCSAIQNDEPSSASTDLVVVNQDGADHAVVVEIDDIGDAPDPTYADGRTLAAESDAELDPFEGAGEYVVTVTVDGESTELTHTFGADEDVLNVGIDNEGDVTLG